MNKLILFNMMAIKHLEGGTYNVDSVVNAIKKLTNICITVGLPAIGVALVVCFIIYAVADVERKQQVKQRIIQTMLGIAGTILAISLVNLIIDLF